MPLLSVAWLSKSQWSNDGESQLVWEITGPAPPCPARRPVEVPCSGKDAGTQGQDVGMRALRDGTQGLRDGMWGWHAAGTGRGDMVEGDGTSGPSAFCARSSRTRRSFRPHAPRAPHSGGEKCSAPPGPGGAGLPEELDAVWSTETGGHPGGADRQQGSPHIAGPPPPVLRL